MHRRNRQGGLLRLVAAFFCFVALATALHPVPAQAEDVEIAISGQALERFFQAAAPFKFAYELIPGQTAAEITLTNPKINLIPGSPGKIFLNLDYQGESKLLGLAPFSGRTRPEATFSYDPARSALKVSLAKFRIKLESGSELPLDGLLEPFYIPLTSAEPLRLEKHSVKIQVTGVKTRVTQTALQVLANYTFVQAPLK